MKLSPSHPYPSPRRWFAQREQRTVGIVATGRGDRFRPLPGVDGQNIYRERARGVFVHLPTRAAAIAVSDAAKN